MVLSIKQRESPALSLDQFSIGFRRRRRRHRIRRAVRRAVTASSASSAHRRISTSLQSSSGRALPILCSTPPPPPSRTSPPHHPYQHTPHTSYYACLTCSMCDVRISRFVHIIYPYEYVICIHPLSSSSSFDYVNRVSCACHLYTSSIIIIIIWLRKSRGLCMPSVHILYHHHHHLATQIARAVPHHHRHIIII